MTKNIQYRFSENYQESDYQKTPPKQNKTPRSDNPKQALDAEDEEYSHIHKKGNRIVNP